MKGLVLPEAARFLSQSMGVHDDFRAYTDTNEWTKLAADGGTSVAAGDTENGVLALTTGATDNNEAAVRTTKKIFLIGDDKPHVFETYLKFTEANTDDANVFAGFASALGADTLQDNGAGPQASFTGAFFYKTDSATNGNTWWAGLSLGATQSLVQLLATTTRNKVAQTIGTAFTKLKIEVLPKTSVLADVMFWINDICVYKFTDWTFTSAAAMYAGAYVKAGGANSEVLNVDYISAYKLR